MTYFNINIARRSPVFHYEDISECSEEVLLKVLCPQQSEK